MRKFLLTSNLNFPCCNLGRLLLGLLSVVAGQLQPLRDPLHCRESRAASEAPQPALLWTERAQGPRPDPSPLPRRGSGPGRAAAVPSRGAGRERDRAASSRRHFRAGEETPAGLEPPPELGQGHGELHPFQSLSCALLGGGDSRPVTARGLRRLAARPVPPGQGGGALGWGRGVLRGGEIEARLPC